MSGRFRECKRNFEENLSSRLSAKVNSWSCDDFVSCIEAMWGMEWAQPHYPLVLTVLQPLTLTAPAASTALVTRIPQPLTGCLNMVKEGKIQMSDVSCFDVLLTPVLEMFVKGCIIPILVLAGLLGLRPSSTDIWGASNIQKLTAGIMSQIHKPDHLVPHASRQVNILQVNSKSSSKVVQCYKWCLHHVTAHILSLWRLQW